MKKILILESIHNDGVEKLKKHFNVQFLLSAPRTELLDAVKDASAIIIKSRTRVDQELINHAPQLKIIGRAGTGTDNIDKEYAKSRGILVMNVPTGNSRSAAEFTLMQILATCKNSYQAISAIKENDFRRDQFQGVELSTQTVGIIGLGNVGSIVAQLLKPFGCQIIAYDIRKDMDARCRTFGTKKINSLDELIKQSDIVTLHVPLNHSTQNMIGKNELKQMKKGVKIVNCARGGIIDETDLLQAVDAGHVSTVCIDVLEQEPSYDIPPSKQTYRNPLLSHPHVTITPHLAASTIDAQRNIANQLVQNMISVLNYEK